MSDEATGHKTIAPQVEATDSNQSEQQGLAPFLDEPTSLVRLKWSHVLMLALGAGLVLLGLLANQSSENDLPSSLSFILLGLALFALAGFALQRGIKSGAAPDWLHTLARWLSVKERQILMLMLAPIFSILAWFAAGDAPLMRHPWIAVPAWLLAMILVIAAAWPSQPLNRKKLAGWEIGLILALLGFALILRVPSLGSIPWLATGDEGASAVSAVHFINGEQNNIFTIGWFSFPALYFFVESLFIRLFGHTIFAMRILAALIGSLTIVALYWYASQVLGKWVAIFASAYLAASHFHIHFSRIGLNNIWDGFFVALISATLWHAWRHAENDPDRSRMMFVVTGLLFGISQYFYSSIRILCLVLPVWLFWIWLHKRTALSPRLPGLALMLVGTLAAVLPLALFYARFPQEFAAPLNRVSIMGEWLRRETELRDASAFKILLSQFRIAMGAYTHNELRMFYAPGSPLLRPVPGAFFLLGVTVALFRINKPRYAWPLLWLAATLPMIALSDATPAAQRMVIAIPVASLFFAVGLIQLGQWIYQAWPKTRRWVLAGMTIVLMLAAAIDIQFYFGDYSLRHEFSDLNTEVANVLAHHLQDREQDTHVYFFGPPRMGYNSHPILPFLNPGLSGEDVVEPITDTEGLEVHGHTTFIFLPERKDEMSLVQKAFPGGTVSHATGRKADILYFLYEFERQ